MNGHAPVIGFIKLTRRYCLACKKLRLNYHWWILYKSFFLPSTLYFDVFSPACLLFESCILVKRSPNCPVCTQRCFDACTTRPQRWADFVWTFKQTLCAYYVYVQNIYFFVYASCKSFFRLPYILIYHLIVIKFPITRVQGVSYHHFISPLRTKSINHSFIFVSSFKKYKKWLHIYKSLFQSFSKFKKKKKEKIDGQTELSFDKRVTTSALEINFCFDSLLRVKWLYGETLQIKKIIICCQRNFQRF